MCQDGLHGLDGLRPSYLFLQNHGFKLLYHLPFLHHLTDEAWLYELAVVGNGVVESQRVDGRNLRLITDGHPG